MKKNNNPHTMHCYT